MNFPRLLASAILLLGAGLCGTAARAEPYLAVQQGYACAACHVNPTGGGLRNDFGVVFAQNVLPANSFPDVAGRWTGRLGEFVRLGGDLRSSWSSSQQKHGDELRSFQLDQLRVYGAAELLPDRLVLYVDEQLSPGNAQTQEAYVRYGSAAHGWYAQAGKFYLPFGWRLQDNTAFVREVSGINMATPDNGVAVGYANGPWSAQLAVTNGIANAQSGGGHQATLYGVYLTPRGRIGASASETSSDLGNRQVYGVFAGLRTGPVAWLGELDAVRDAGFPEGTRTLAAALAEADWAIARGHSLKLAAEWFDPDRDVSEDDKVRYSAVYEWTPVPFLQLRAGARVYRGIPQSDPDNRQAVFIEAHAFF
jgi:hypothetical protein